MEILLASKAQNVKSLTGQEKKTVFLQEAPAQGKKKRKKKAYVMLQGHKTHLNGMDHLCEREDQRSRTEIKILKGLQGQFHEFI